MNIKLKAAVEVAGIIAAITVVVVGAKTILDAAAAAYGETAVVEAISCFFIGAAAYVAVGLLYDMRVAKLQYREKLTEMVKK
jgi:hypothetical protein